MTALTPPNITASQEDYLEAIWQIVEDKQAVRAKDISARLGVRGASVTGALHTLGEKGLVNYAPYDVITLTPRGRAAARDVVRRHEALRDFFVKILKIDPETAEDAACRMEHAMPPIVLERMARYVKQVEGQSKRGRRASKAARPQTKRSTEHPSDG